MAKNKISWYKMEIEKLQDIYCFVYISHSRDNMNINHREKYPVVGVKQVEKIEEIKEDLTKYFD